MFQIGFAHDEADAFNRFHSDEFENDTGRKPHLFSMIDLGFELWTNSFRGGRYNRGHVTLDADSEEYWDFSMYELAAYDTPAALDYIYDQNGGEKIILLSKSNAATIAHLALSTDLEETRYVDRVERAVAIAPCSGVVNFGWFTGIAEIKAEEFGKL